MTDQQKIGALMIAAYAFLICALLILNRLRKKRRAAWMAAQDSPDQRSARGHLKSLYQAPLVGGTPDDEFPQQHFARVALWTLPQTVRLLLSDDPTTVINTARLIAELETLAGVTNTAKLLEVDDNAMLRTRLLAEAYETGSLPLWLGCWWHNNLPEPNMKELAELLKEHAKK